LLIRFTHVNDDEEIRMNHKEAVAVESTGDGDTITRQQWKWSGLAGMASYLDAGSIVALSAGLSLFQTYLHLNSGAVGMRSPRSARTPSVVLSVPSSAAG
jgi:hypothetical protein